MITTTADDDNRPFASWAWNQTAAKACSQQLLWQIQKREPVAGRPDRITSLDRRDRGSALHEFARLSLHLLFDRGRWPSVERTMQAVLRSGAGKDRAGEPLAFMAGPGYPGLWDALGELAVKARLFTEKFPFSADDAIGNECFVATDAEGQVASYWDVPAGGWHGRVDWAELSADYKLRVIDFKNRPAIHPQAELRGHEQLSLYALLLSHHYPRAREQPVKIGVYYFEYGVCDEVELTWDEIEVNVERLRARVRAKRQTRLSQIAPEPGFGRCQYCEYLGDCPAGLRLLDGNTQAPVDAASARRLAESLFVIEELRKAAIDGLKAYCEEHGAVEVAADTGYGFILQPEYDVDTAKTLAVLADAGIDPMKALRWDRDELKKLGKRDKALSEALGACVFVAREKTLFKAHKPEKVKIRVAGKVRGRVRRGKNQPETTGGGQ